MRFIESDPDLTAAVDTITGQSLLALDTEAAGYHRYSDKVCLVQLSTRTETWVVDALAVDIAPLGTVLHDARTEIVLHDADYDLRLLGRDHGLGVARLFDTKVAAQLLGEKAIGLAGLAERYLDIRMDKTHQRADWARRPLSPNQLEYAAEDTRHLPKLRDCLADALAAAGRMNWALEEFRLRTSFVPDPDAPDIEAFWKLRNIRDLRGKQLAVLRAVNEWRDEKAQGRDVAPFRVIGNNVVVGIARHCPTTKKDLGSMEGMPGSLLERYGAELVAVVRQATRSEPETWPIRRRGPRRPPPDPAFEQRVERLKGARDKVADALDLERGFLMPRAQLEEIARLQPATVAELKAVSHMRNWQIEACGTQIMNALG